MSHALTSEVEVKTPTSHASASEDEEMETPTMSQGDLNHDKKDSKYEPWRFPSRR